jgi:hypothetical protein
MKSKELLAENLIQGLDEQNKNSVLEQMAHTYNIWTAEQNLSLFFYVDDTKLELCKNFCQLPDK